MDDNDIIDALDRLRGSVEQRARDATATVDRAVGIVDRIKDNIAWLLGLPATIGGALGFIWDTGNDRASLAWQVTQLEDAVAELKAENDLLGGGVKNFSLDLSAAPGGPLTPLLAGAGIAIAVAALVWYQHRRRR